MHDGESILSSKQAHVFSLVLANIFSTPALRLTKALTKEQGIH